MKFTVMITTLNRLNDLQRTCEVLSSLEPQPFEVLITADGCTDETVSYIQANYPGYHLIVNQSGRGSVASRAAMMQRASGDLVLALDDDSYPEQLDCLRSLAIIFEENPKLAIATFPQRTDEYPDTLSQTDFGIQKPIRSFANSGACLRVSAYRDLPGFEPMFFHMYEEPDYAIQCIANGWEVRYFPQITIRHHFTGTGRSEVRNHHRHARNELWSALIRCPMPYVLGIILYRICSQSLYAAKRGPAWLIREPLWWLQALKGLPRALRYRKPLSWNGYRKWLELPSR
jgi:GT2 family glycosyltransferase